MKTVSYTEKNEILDNALSELKSKIDKPFTYAEWRGRMRPLALIPAGDSEVDHIDLDEYNEMCYNVYLKNFKDENLRFYNNKKEIIDCVKSMNLKKKA